MSEYDFATDFVSIQLDAFNYIPNYCKLSTNVTCSASNGNDIYIGSIDGLVLKYISEEEEPGKYIVKHDIFINIYSRYSVTQIEIVEDANILIALCANKIHFLSLQNLKIVSTLEEFKNIHKFQYFPIENNDLLPFTNMSYFYLALLLKYKIKLIRMKKSEIDCVMSEIDLDEHCSDFYFISTTNFLVLQYSNWNKFTITQPKNPTLIYKIPSKTKNIRISNIKLNGANTLWPPFIGDTLVSYDKNNIKTIKDVIDDGLVQSIFFLTFDYYTHIFLHFNNGRIDKIFTVLWNENPILTEFAFPYILAFFETGRIEIRYGNNFVQNIMIDNLNIVSVSRHIDFVNRMWKDSQLQTSLFVMSHSSICRLYQFPIKTQIENALNRKAYVVASVLSNYLNLTDKSNLELHHRAKQNCALMYFAECKFKQSFQIFKDLKTDPLSVVSLIPNVCLHSYSSTINLNDDFNFRIPKLKGGDLEAAVNNAIDYLTDVRLLYPYKNYDDRNYSALLNTIIRFYIMANPNMVLPMLSLHHNLNLADELEELLKQHQLYKELTYFYLNKKLHCEALNIIKLLLTDPQFEIYIFAFLKSTKISSVDQLNIYLQIIAKSHPLIVFDFLVHSMPPYCLDRLPDVCAFIVKHLPTHAVAFLDVIIYKWKFTQPFYHNMYIKLKTAQVETSLAVYYESETHYVKPGEEEIKIVSTNHLALVQLLITNLYYEADKIISNFNFQYFHYERVILLDRMNNLKEGFRRFLLDLNDHALVEDLALKLWEEKKIQKLSPEECSQPLLALTQLYFSQDSSNHDLGIQLFFNNFHIFSYNQISNIFFMFPTHYPLKRLMPFLSKSLSLSIHLIHSSMSFNQISLFTRNLNNVKLQFYSTKRVHIESTTECYVCRKPIGLSSFSAKADGTVSHQHCSK